MTIREAAWRGGFIKLPVSPALLRKFAPVRKLEEPFPVPAPGIGTVRLYQLELGPEPGGYRLVADLLPLAVGGN